MNDNMCGTAKTSEFDILISMRLFMDAEILSETGFPLKQSRLS